MDSGEISLSGNHTSSSVRRDSRNCMALDKYCTSHAQGLLGAPSMASLMVSFTEFPKSHLWLLWPVSISWTPNHATQGFLSPDAHSNVCLFLTLLTNLFPPIRSCSSRWLAGAFSEHLFSYIYKFKTILPICSDRENSFAFAYEKKKHMNKVIIIIIVIIITYNFLLSGLLHVQWPTVALLRGMMVSTGGWKPRAGWHSRGRRR